MALRRKVKKGEHESEDEDYEADKEKIRTDSDESDSVGETAPDDVLPSLCAPLIHQSVPAVPLYFDSQRRKRKSHSKVLKIDSSGTSEPRRIVSATRSGPRTP